MKLDRLLQCLPCLFVFVLFTCFLAGCSDHNIRRQIQDVLAIHEKNPYLYVLEFDNDGNLTSPEEPVRAIRELRQNEDIDGVVVLSMGWGHDRDTIVPEYRKLLDSYGEYKRQELKKEKKSIPKNKKAVFVISWESSLTGAGHFIGDILPLPEKVLDVLSVPFEPVTYWSKARQADRIGFGELKSAMVEIVTEVNEKRKHPLDLYVVAHSFGSRVVTGMLNMSDNISKEFPKNTVKGGLLIEPALSSYELHSLGSKSKDSPSYPLLVTESRHDHLNRLMFPLVNIPLNSAYLRYSSDLFKSSILEKFIGPDTDSSSYKPWSSGYDYVMFPLMIPYSALVAVDSYVFGQVSEIFDRKWSYIPDTLAQLPLLEIPVEIINTEFTSIQQPDDYWGQRHKGLFHMGGMLESSATIVTENTHGIFYILTKSLGKLLDTKTLGVTAHVVRQEAYTQGDIIKCYPSKFPNGVISIDMSKEIRAGIVGEDLNKHLTDWTIGWLDPVGAHTDYTDYIRNPEIFELIYRLIDRPDASADTPSGNLISCNT